MGIKKNIYIYKEKRRWSKLPDINHNVVKIDTSDLNCDLSEYHVSQIIYILIKKVWSLILNSINGIIFLWFLYG